MKISDFDYTLPPELIAQEPAIARDASKLLFLDGGDSKIGHLRFSDFPSLLNPKDLLVFNNTRVIPARLWGRKDSGGKVEILVERLIGVHRVLAHVRGSRPSRVGTILNLSVDQNGPTTGIHLSVESEENGLFILKTEGSVTFASIMDRVGQVPLPPYISRSQKKIDIERYQTVFAKVDGAIAAPTAGLHFTEDLLKRISDIGIKLAEVTLHVGSGTFQPVRTKNIQDHVMHSEQVYVDETVCEQIKETRKNGGRVIAIGTTAVRALETAAVEGWPSSFSGESQLFIYPGYDFKCVDALLTNFHLPRSTLLMLVSAFAGRECVLAAYQEAISREYRFFSYGDAMFISQPKKQRCYSKDQPK